MPYTIDQIASSGQGSVREETMRLRIEPLLKDICKEAAKSEGLGLSAWVRRLLLQELTKLGYIEPPRRGG